MAPGFPDWARALCRALSVTPPVNRSERSQCNALAQAACAISCSSAICRPGTRVAARWTRRQGHALAICTPGPCIRGDTLHQARATQSWMALLRTERGGSRDWFRRLYTEILRRWQRQKLWLVPGSRRGLVNHRRGDRGSERRRRALCRCRVMSIKASSFVAGRTDFRRYSRRSLPAGHRWPGRQKCLCPGVRAQ